MEHVYFKAGKRFTRIGAAFIALSAVLGIFAARTPLLNVVGYELGAMLGIFAAIVGSALGAVAGRDTSRPEISPNVSYAHLVSVKFVQCMIFGIASLAVPLGTVAVGTYYFRRCNLGSGLPLAAAICVPTLFHYTAAGIAAGRMFRRPAGTALALFGYFLATSIYSFALFMSASQSSLLNLTIGMFSLTGFYGFGLSIPDSFYPSRLLTLFMSTFFIGAAVLANPQQHTARNKTDVYLGRRDTIAAAIVFLICLLAAPDQTGLGNGRRTLNRILSATRETPHAVLHFEKDKLSRMEIRRVERYTEWYIHEIKDAVPMSPKWKTDVYLYTDAAQMSRLVGAPDFYFAAPWLHEVHIRLDSTGNRIYKHELTHALLAVYGAGIFGTPYNIGVVEGAAEAVEDDLFRGPAFQEYFAAAIKARVAAPAAQTMSNVGFGAANMWKSYEMAGGFIGFLINKYGVDKFKLFYADPVPEKVYGKNLKELNNEWKKWLEAAPVSPQALRYAAFRYDDTQFPAFYKTECPRVGSRDKTNDPYERFTRALDNDDFDEAASICMDSYRKYSNPSWLVGLSHLYMENGQFKKALAAADHAIAAKKIKPETYDTALNRRACALFSLGLFDEAAETIHKRIDFGFIHHDLAEKMLLVVKRESIRDILMPAFCAQKKIPQASYLKAIEFDPDFGITYAELAEHLDENEFPDKAAYLARRNELVTKFISLTPGFEWTKRRLLISLGESYLDFEKYDDAATAYERALPFTQNEAQRFEVRRNIEKARFFKNIRS